jgi:hypothetical protein
MIEYHVYQKCFIVDDFIIDVYRGMDKEQALHFFNVSEQDLAKSAVGHNWKTIVEHRLISDWQTLDMTD